MIFGVKDLARDLGALTEASQLVVFAVYPPMRAYRSPRRNRYSDRVVVAAPVIRGWRRRSFPESSVRYTSWEFPQVFDSPALRNKTVFHMANGVVVPGPAFSL